MDRLHDDRLHLAATRFIADASERVRADALAAIQCLECGSSLGVRQHLTAVRRWAGRRALIERKILHTSSRAAQLERAAGAALAALDAGSPARLTRALARVEALAGAGRAG